MEPPPQFEALPKWPTLLNSDGAYHVPKEDFATTYMVLVQMLSYIETQYARCKLEDKPQN